MRRAMDGLVRRVPVLVGSNGCELCNHELGGTSPPPVGPDLTPEQYAEQLIATFNISMVPEVGKWYGAEAQSGPAGRKGALAQAASDGGAFCAAEMFSEALSHSPTSVGPRRYCPPRRFFLLLTFIEPQGASHGEH